MTSDVFGNSPSTAVATCEILKTVSRSSDAVQSFVHNAFYVDDALMSVSKVEEAVNLIKETRPALQRNGKIHLHKIASSNIDVIKEFSKVELGKDLKDLNLNADITCPSHLGINMGSKH